MSVIYDIAGTSSDTFMLNGKLTFMQGEDAPLSYEGQNGDVYFQTNGNIWVKIDGVWSNISALSMPTPEDVSNHLVYSNGSRYVATPYTYDEVALKSDVSDITTNVTIDGTLTTNEKATLNDGLTVSGTTVLNGGTTINNTLTTNGASTFNSTVTAKSGVELVSNTPYIDFHYGSSSADYTSRIIESANGVLSITSANGAQNNASNSTSSTAIATQGWVNDPTKSTNVVHRTGDETINGTKTFTSTINGTAMYALWGDIIEFNAGDDDYPFGTLVQFGGEEEFTIATTEANGVVGNVETAAFVMNSSELFKHALPIVLKGRVKVRVDGDVKKFDKLYLSKTLPGIATNVPNGEHIGTALTSNADGYVLANVSARY